MARKLEKVEIIPATQERAREHLALPSGSGDRGIKPERMKYLEKEHAEGRLGPLTWTVAREKKTGKMYRINGQHTATLLNLLPKERFPVGLPIIYETYLIDSIEEDGPILWEQKDNPRSARTNTEKMGTFIALYPDLKISRELGVSVASAYHYYLKGAIGKNGHRPITYDPRNFGQYFADTKLRSFAVWLNKWEKWEEINEGKTARAPNRWMIRKANIIAATYEGWKKEPKIATEFWGYVFLDNHPDRNDPSRVLSRTLRELLKGAEKVKPAVYHHEATKRWEQYLKRATGPR
jgi:hypothetical protein